MALIAGDGNPNTFTSSTKTKKNRNGTTTQYRSTPKKAKASSADKRYTSSMPKLVTVKATPGRKPVKARWSGWKPTSGSGKKTTGHKASPSHGTSSAAKAKAAEKAKAQAKANAAKEKAAAQAKEKAAAQAKAKAAEDAKAKAAKEAAQKEAYKKEVLAKYDLKNDANYQAEKGDAENAYKIYEAEQNELIGNSERDHLANKGVIGQNRSRTLTSNTEDFAARGLARSGVFSKTTDDITDTFNKQDKSNDDAKTDAVNVYTRNKTSKAAARDATIASATRDAQSRRQTNVNAAFAQIANGQYRK